MANLSHMSIAQAEALGTEKVQTLIRNQANATLNTMSIEKAKSLGTKKVNELLNLSQTGLDSKDQEEKVINNTITAHDSLVRRYGIRQEIVIKNNKEDPNIKARRILADNCKPTEEIEVECIGDLDYRVGFGVHVYLPFLTKYADCLMYIKSVEHEWKPNGMFISKLTLTPSRVMDEKEWSDITEDEEDSVSSSGSDLWEKIYPLLKQQIGKPYVWGAHGPDSFDCSGLVEYCYNQFKSEIGETIGWTTYEQKNNGKSVGKDLSEAQEGDLLLWTGNGSYSPPSHVSVYVGNNQMIHAPHTGDVVKIADITRTDIYDIRRVLPEAVQIYDDISVDIPAEAVNKVKALCEDAVSATIRNMSIGGYKEDLIKAAKELDVTPYMLLAIIAIESNGDSKAESSAGAVGLCQVLPSNTYGEDIYNNIGNMRAGCKCYNEKFNYYNSASTFIALSAYNYGQGSVDKVLIKAGKTASNISIQEYINACPSDQNKYYACKVLYANSLLRSKKVLN